MSEEKPEYRVKTADNDRLFLQFHRAQLDRCPVCREPLHRFPRDTFTPPVTGATLEFGPEIKAEIAAIGEHLNKHRSSEYLSAFGSAQSRIQELEDALVVAASPGSLEELRVRVHRLENRAMK